MNFDPTALQLDISSGRLFSNTLLSAEDITRAATPYDSVCGVYFLVLGQEVVYVGQSKNIMARMESHRKRFQFTKFAFLPTPRHLLDLVESLYIHTLRPRHNGVVQTPSGAVVCAPLTMNQILELSAKAIESTSAKTFDTGKEAA